MRADMTFKLNNWLVARLSKPVGYVNPFGACSPEAQTELKDVVSFDYMGAAEYEYGAIPKCLSNMWKMPLILETISTPDEAKVELAHIVRIRTIESDKLIESIQDIYEKGKNDSIKEVSKGDYGSYYKALHNDSEAIGWLNIKHYFAWFIDKEVAVDFLNHLDNQGDEE